MKTKKPSFRTPSITLLGCLGVMFMLGCSSPGPSLKSLNQREAKIEVWPDGTMFVHGEKVPIDNLAEVIKNSSTAPSDPIFIRLNDDVDSIEMQNIRHRINDQMVRCGHYKYAYFSAPQASVSTLDKKTGKYTTIKQRGIIEAASGEAMHREIDRMEAEANAYEAGTYRSDALNLDVQQQHVIIESEAEALAHTAEDLSASELRRLSSRRKGATPKKNATAVVNPSENSEDLTSEEALRKAYLRQQRRQKSGATTRQNQ